MAQYKAEILAGKHRKHKMLCKIQIIQNNTTRYSIFFCFGKDEVSGSNPDSSSTKTALFAWKGRFCFAFCDFFAYLKFVIAALTTEQATDREKWVSEGVLPPEARCFFRLPFPVLSSKQSPASFPESAGPVFFHIPPRCRHRRCGPRVFR